MKSVTICSSNRFAKEAIAFAAKLKKSGVTLYEPHFYTYRHGGLDKVEGHNKKFIAMGLTLDHFRKIEKADAVFFYNKGGYFGNSTTLELGYASALKKPVYVLTDKDEEVCRGILFDGCATTSAALIKLLK